MDVIPNIIDLLRQRSYGLGSLDLLGLGQLYPTKLLTNFIIYSLVFSIIKGIIVGFIYKRAN